MRLLLLFPEILLLSISPLIIYAVIRVWNRFSNTREEADELILKGSWAELSEILVVATILLAINWGLAWHAVSGTTAPPPPRFRMSQNLQQIEYALEDYFLATGSAPTRVSNLKTLRGKYLETDESLDEMLDTGRDYWGNPLLILPVRGQPGRFALRSLGPDGMLQTGPDGDDIVVTYTAESHSPKHLEPGTKNSF